MFQGLEQAREPSASGRSARLGAGWRRLRGAPVAGGLRAGGLPRVRARRRPTTSRPHSLAKKQSSHRSVPSYRM